MDRGYLHSVSADDASMIEEGGRKKVIWSMPGEVPVWWWRDQGRRGSEQKSIMRSEGIVSLV